MFALYSEHLFVSTCCCPVGNIIAPDTEQKLAKNPL
nr:MAG TPA: hypothetical protein [Caudoviricetes sp.]